MHIHLYASIYIYDMQVYVYTGIYDYVHVHLVLHMGNMIMRDRDIQMIRKNKSKTIQYDQTL